MAESECASLGAAILVAVALGHYASVGVAAAASNAVRASFEPRPENSRAYEKSYAAYKKFYDRVKDLF